MDRVLRLAAAPRLRRPRLPVRVLAFAAAAAVVLGAAFMWLRDSSLVAVREVTVVGVSSSEGDEVRAALERAAREMTTLHVRADELREAVASYTTVAGLRVQTDFPRGLTIEVQERHPVGAVEFAGRVIPVGAGGRLMRGVRPEGRLALVKADSLAPGGRLTDREALAAVGVLAAAPEPLRARAERVRTTERGLVVDLREGPQLVFGTPQDARVKWMAAARVLAEPAAAGAVYLDVRVPERVAAGGLGAVTDELSEPLVPESRAQVPNAQPQPETTPSLNP